jgi:hypothetical protein
MKEYNRNDYKWTEFEWKQKNNTRNDSTGSNRSKAGINYSARSMAPLKSNAYILDRKYFYIT